MKMSAVITQIVAMAMVANEATSTMTEMALRAYQANASFQSARQKLLKSGYRRRLSTARRIPAGSAMSLNGLIERARQLNLYYEMLKITNSYKSRV